MPRTRPLVLAVDDNADLANLVQTVLSLKGFDCVKAESGNEGWTEAVQRRPDLIILDWMMPDVDGVEILRRLKSDRRTACIPVVMFSARDMPDEIRTALEAGASDYWVKSRFDFGELARKSRQLIASHGECKASLC
jgi:two-component system, OmpR family, phosphate regulon response regulator PhoB